MKRFESLRKTEDFRAVYRKKKSKADKYFVMYVLENGKDINRLGISVSKKVGNSVVRHRLFRLVREAIRLHEDEFNSGLDIVVIARESANPQKDPNNHPDNDSYKKELKCRDVERSLLHLSRLHKVIDP